MIRFHLTVQQREQLPFENFKSFSKTYFFVAVLFIGLFALNCQVRVMEKLPMPNIVKSTRYRIKHCCLFCWHVIKSCGRLMSTSDKRKLNLLIRYGLKAQISRPNKNAYVLYSSSADPILWINWLIQACWAESDSLMFKSVSPWPPGDIIMWQRDRHTDTALHSPKYLKKPKKSNMRSVYWTVKLRAKSECLTLS